MIVTSATEGDLTRSRSDRSGDDSGCVTCTLAVLEPAVGEFALSETLTALPRATFQCEPGVDSADDSVLPLLWARNVAREELEAAFEEDPSVERARLVEDCGDEYLYHVEWSNHVKLCVDILTNGAIHVRDASATSSGWSLRVVFPDRGSLSEAHTLCEELGVSVEVTMARGTSNDPANRFGLTTEQMTVLRTASDHGYFQVPREVDLRDLANAFGVSHQALSERLRRGHDALIQNTITGANGGR